jgi:putative membrane protein
MIGRAMASNPAKSGKYKGLAAAFLASCVFIAAPAFAQSGVSAAGFAAQAAVADIFEIDSARLVEEKDSPNAANLAVPLARDHAAILAELKSLVQTGNVKAELPDRLDAAHQAKLDKLKALKGGAFDKGYFDTQVDVQKHHVAFFERYAKTGDNAALKSLAAKHLPILQKHLKAVSDLREVIMDE